MVYMPASLKAWRIYPFKDLSIQGLDQILVFGLALIL